MMMAHCILYSIMVFGLWTMTAGQSVHHHSVFFLKENEYYITQSKWLTSFVISLGSYEKALGRLERQAEQVMSLLNNAIHVNNQNATNPTLQYRGRLYLTLEEDRLLILQRNIKLLINQFKELKLIVIKDRTKRSLLPFVGNILNNLFGTATAGDLDKVKKQLNELAKGEEEINHIIADSISIINITRMEVTQNRNVLNQIINVTDALQKKLNKEQESLQSLVQQEAKFGDHHFQINSFISHLEVNFFNIQIQVTNLEMQMNFALQHKLNPTLISAAQLRNLLQTIAISLPSVLKLPYDITTDLIRYYQTLTVTAMPISDGLMVILQIPILDITSKYEVYKILNVPVPYPKTSLIAQFDINHDYFAISSDRCKVSFLSRDEFLRCSIPNRVFCSMLTSLYPIAMLSTDCIMHLFITKSYNDDFCTIKVSHTNNTLPKLYHVLEGNWVITTSVPFILHINCIERSVPDLQITPPMAYVKLTNGCGGTSPYIIIPPFFYRKSTFKILEPQFQVPSNLSLWSYQGHDDTIRQALIHIPEALPHTPDVSYNLKGLVSHLNAHLQKMKDVQDSLKSTTSYPWYMYLSIVLGIILLIVIIIIIVYCKYLRTQQPLKVEKLCKRPAQAYFNKALSSVTLNEPEPEPEPSAISQTTRVDSSHTKTPGVESHNRPSTTQVQIY